MKDRCLYILLFLVGMFSEAEASHFAGGDLTYRCVGQDSFKITTKIYRDCSGTWFGGTSIDFQVFAQPQSGNTYAQKTIRVYNRTMRVVDFDCSSLRTFCIPNPNFTYGLEQYTIDTTLHLPTFFGTSWNNNLCKVEFRLMPLCCRNSSTNTQGNGGFALRAFLNRCEAPWNNSPQLVNAPVLLVCNGALTSFNMGAIDTFEYDSFSYSFIQPLANEDGVSVIPFSSGFSFQRPFFYLGDNVWTLSIDSINGDLRFISNQLQQPTIAIKISEWRLFNGVWREVGFIIRDMQFYSVQCAPNNAPVVEFFPNTKLQQICQGQSTCFTVRARDPDSAYGHADTTVISWNYSLKGATFSSLNTPVKTVKNDVATICWTADSSRVKPSPYWMVLRVTDGYCPISSSNAYALGVVVNPNFTVSIQRQAQPCQTFRLVAKPSRYLYSAKYVWRAHRTSSGVYTDSLAVLIGSDSVLTYRFTTPGTYIIRLGVTTNGACEKYGYDTLQVDTPFSVNLSTNRNAVCKGDSVQLTASAVHEQGAVRFMYFVNLDSIQHSTVFKLLPLFSQAIRVWARDSMGCVAQDTLSVHVDSIPTVNLQAEYWACPGDTILADAGDNGGNGGVSYEWYRNNMLIDSQRVVKLIQQDQYIVKLSYANGCAASDTTQFRLVNLQNDYIRGEAVVCKGNPALLHADGIAFRWFNLTDSLKYPHSVSDSIIQFVPDTNTRIALQVTKKYAVNTCVAYDTLLIQVNALPVVQVSTSAEKVCCGTLAHVISEPRGGILTLNALPIVDSFLVSCTQTQRLQYRFTDSVGCVNTDTFTVNTELPLAGFIQLSADTACVTDSVLASVNITAGTPVSFDWSVSGSGASHAISPSVLSYTFSEIDEQKKQVLFRVTVKPNGICPDVKMDATVHVAPTPTVTASLIQPDSVCAPAKVDVQLGAIDAVKFVWYLQTPSASDSVQTSGSNIQAQYDKRGVYIPKVKLISANRCMAQYTYPLPVRVFDSPVIYAKSKAFSMLPDGVDWNNQVVQFSDSVSGTYPGEKFSLTWELDIQLIATFQNSPNRFIHFLDKADIDLPHEWHPKVRLVTDKGCTTETRLPPLQFVPPLQVFIPNAIRTYSSEVENQTFGVIAHNYIDAHLQIYNRWGQQIFETNELSERWNATSGGVNVPEGNYFYFLYITDVNQEEHRYSGSIAVMH